MYDTYDRIVQLHVVVLYFTLLPVRSTTTVLLVLFICLRALCIYVWEYTVIVSQPRSGVAIILLL